MPAPDVSDLRVGRGDGAPAPFSRCGRGRHPGIEVHRFHLGQQLPGGDGVADVDEYASDAPGGGGSDQVGASGLDGANAEERGGHIIPHNWRHRHWDRRKRAALRGHPPEREEQPEGHHRHPYLARNSEAPFHDVICP